MNKGGQMDNINVFYVFGDNYGIIGNVTAPVNLYHASNIHNSHIAQGNSASAEKPLTDNEKELLRLFSKLGIVEQSRIIVYADELTNNRRTHTMNSITINNKPLQIKEYQGNRVVTLKDIDTVHDRPDGTARRRFNDNKKRFIEGVDYFKITASEFRTLFGGLDARYQMDITLITESGYLMLVKSFTDDLAWQVQRELVNTYFRAKEIINEQAERFDPQAAYTGAQRLGDVVELAKLTARLMKDNKRRPADILQTVGEQLEQFGVPIPEGFFLGSFTSEGIDRSNTVAAFLAEYGDVTGEAVIDVYDAYLDYCRRTGNRPIPSTRGFGSEIVKQTGIHTKTRQRNGKAVRVYMD